LGFCPRQRDKRARRAKKRCAVPAVSACFTGGARPYGKNCWAGKPAFITGTSGGAIGTALAQQHLRSIMLSLGTILQGGDVYVTFKPNLVDDDGNISDDSTRKFLQGFIDQFASLVTRLAPQPARTA
jgi:chromate reductase, NAD(P)H dehydrogenase (quinone)